MAVNKQRKKNKDKLKIRKRVKAQLRLPRLSVYRL